MISIIILTWNSEQYIENCLRRLFNDIETSRKNAEVIVVDGGSTDNTLNILDKLEKVYDNLESIRMGVNKGTTVSRNIGIKESSGKYIFFLDSDTEVQPGTFDTLLETFENDEKIGIAAPRLLFPDNSVQRSCKHFPTAKIKLYKFLPFKKTRKAAEREELYDSQIYSHNFKEIIEVDHCISAAWLVKREAVNDIGLFDENIFYSPEDVDYCLRTWLNGWKVVYDPRATVVHHTQRASYKNPKITLAHLKGLIYFFRKYNYWFNREMIYEKISERNASNYLES